MKVLKIIGAILLVLILLVALLPIVFKGRIIDEVQTLMDENINATVEVEDIDLSFRIQKAGFRNVYFPDTQIIHYKGESTKKSSVNYVFVFYRAMVIFAKNANEG